MTGGGLIGLGVREEGGEEKEEDEDGRPVMMVGAGAVGRIGSMCPFSGAYGGTLQ